MSVNNLEVSTTNQPKMSIEQVNFFYKKDVVHVFTSVVFPKSGIHKLQGKLMLIHLEKKNLRSSFQEIANIIISPRDYVKCFSNDLMLHVLRLKHLRKYYIIAHKLLFYHFKTV